MTKSEFIAIVAECGEMTKTKAAEAVKAYDEAIMRVIGAEEKVRLAWGTVWGETKPAHAARNPATGETIQVPEKHGQPRCKFSKAAKE